MLIVFFDVRGIAHREFIPPVQTVNQEGYLNRLIELISNTDILCSFPLHYIIWYYILGKLVSSEKLLNWGRGEQLELYT